MIIGFLFAIALIGLGSLGWGRTLLFVCDRLGWSSVWQEVQAPLAAVLGMGIFLAVFGVFLAFHLVLVGLLVGWHVIGIVLLGLGRKRTFELKTMLGSLWSWTSLRFCLFGAVVVIFALAALSYPIANTTYNPDDDDAAYLYLAKRMLATGAVIDPFNQRRLVSLGGSTLYQAFILRFAGDSSLQTFEFVFCLLLLWLLVIHTLRRRWLVVTSALLGACLVFLHGIGPISNTSPSFSGALFSLAIFQLLVLVRRGSLARERALMCFVGLLYGAALTLRIYFAVALAIVIVLTLCWRRKELMSWKSLLFLPVTTVAVLIGWSVSSYESTRAWLFPLSSGNYISTFPGSTDPKLALSKLLYRFDHVFLYSGVGGVIALVLAVGTIYLVRERQAGRGVGDVLAFAALGAAVQLGVFAYLQSGAPFDDMWRFEAPTCLAIALLLVDVIWPTVPAVDTRPSTSVQFPRVSRVTIEAGFRFIVVLGALWAAFGVSDLSFYWTTFRSDLTSGAQVVAGSVGLREHYPPTLQAEYRQINRLIPVHSQVFAAVDDPYLLDFAKYNFATLDIVGNVSPPPGMPLGSPTALMDYLRRLGYRYIVFSNPQELGLYNLASWKLDLVSSVYEYRKWGMYFVRWDRLIERIAHNKDLSTAQVGDLALVSLIPSDPLQAAH